MLKNCICFTEVPKHFDFGEMEDIDVTPSQSRQSSSQCSTSFGRPEGFARPSAWQSSVSIGCPDFLPGIKSTG